MSISSTEMKIADKLRESSGPTVLPIGAVADGEYLKRVGSTIVSGTPAGGGSPGGSILGYATASNVVNHNPCPTALTLVDGMTLSITVAADTVVKLESFLRFGKAGNTIRFHLLDGSTELLSAAVNASGSGYNGVYADDGVSGENANRHAFAALIFTLTTGTHTLTAKFEAAGGTESTKLGERYIICQAVA